MTIFNLNKGICATVTKVNLYGGEGERLCALGISEGAKIKVLSFSLLKSSVLISCAAVRVALRRAVAEKIEVSI